MNNETTKLKTNIYVTREESLNLCKHMCKQNPNTEFYKLDGTVGQKETSGSNLTKPENIAFIFRGLILCGYKTLHA